MIFFLFLLGISIGSFLNVLIDRLPYGEDIIKGRSYCDHCHHKLAWYDLVPLLSFIFLRRKCRYCKKLISWQYPAIELISGAFYLCVFIYWSNYFSFLNPIYLFYWLCVISALIAVFMIDLKYHIIPDQLVIFLVVTVSLFEFLLDRSNLINHFLTGIIFFLFFLLLFIITKGRGMGMGDVKFAFFMGFFLGFPKIIISFYLSFLTGALISLILIIIRKKTMKSTIPFGPFLVVATLVSLFYGEILWRILRLYLNL